jgi:hypothetical protein
MAQPQMARIICIQCNALYNSGLELRDHMQRAHRHASLENQTLGTRTGEQDEYIKSSKEKEADSPAQ